MQQFAAGLYVDPKEPGWLRVPYLTGRLLSRSAALAPLTVGLMNSSKPTAAATDPIAVQNGNRAANFSKTCRLYDLRCRDHPNIVSYCVIL